MASLKKFTKKTPPTAVKKAIRKKDKKTSNKRTRQVREMIEEAETEKTTLDTVYIVDVSNRQVTLEVNAGALGQTSGQFIDRRFDNSKIYNAGVWTTIGYTGEKFGSALFLLRVLHNPDRIFANDNAVNTIGDINTF